MKFYGTAIILGAIALAAVTLIAMTPRPASAQAVFYRNACAWSINSFCAKKRAKGLVRGNGAWAARNGYSGYRGR
jgi:hypothetical protein